METHIAFFLLHLKGSLLPTYLKRKVETEEEPTSHKKFKSLINLNRRI